MQRLLLLIVILFLTISAFPQKVVSGFIKDNDGKAASYATLKFFSLSDTTHPQVEKIADETGLYFVQVKDTGKYIAKVAATGMKDTVIAFTVTNNATKLDIVLIPSGNRLGDVIVSAQSNPPMIQRRIDRIVMNVSNNPLSGGKSALELMSLAPGVFVNSDESISINGNNGTHMMVNGKLLQLNGRDLTNYLSNLRAEDIESIEVIAHPPAQYDAEGSGGLINIVLKKNRKAGLNGTINAGYTQGRYAGTNEGVTLNYNKDKLTLFGNYSYNYLKSFFDNTQTNYSGDTLMFTPSHRINYHHGNMVRLGGTYDIDKKQYIGVEYNGSFNYTDLSYSSITNIISPDTLNNNYSDSYAPLIWKSNYNNVSLNYHLNTGTNGSQFEILSDYTHNLVNIQSDNNTVFYDYNRDYLSDTAFGTTTPSTAKIFTADIHYKNVFSRATSLLFGGKISLTNIDNSSTNYYLHNGQKLDSLPLNFDYLYKEKMYAGYASLNTKLLNTEVQLGLRGEYTDISGVLTQLNNNQNNPQHYFKLFPTVFLKRNLNKNSSDFLAFTYSRRIQRPGFSDLNPYQYYSNYYTLTKGNPYLAPSYINSFQLGYTLKNNYNVSAFFSKQINMVGEYWTGVPDSLLTISTYENFGNRYNYGIEFYVPVKVAKWWNMQNDITLRHIKQNGQGYTISVSAIEFQTTQEFILPHSWMISIDGRSHSKGTFGNFVAKPFTIMDLGIQKKLLHNKFIAKVVWNDMFGLMKLSNTAYYDGGAINFGSKRQWQTFQLSLLYNFDLGKTFQTHNLQSSSTEEKSRL